MKYFHRIFSVLLIVGMMLGWTTSGPILASAVPSTTAQVDATAKFEPLVLDQLDAGNADFFVTMAEQADVSYAAQLQTKAEKGQYVFDTLVATADRTQADLRAYLDSKGIQYRSYYVLNAILVKAGSIDLAMAIASRPDVKKISANHTFKLDEPINPKAAPEQPQGVEPNISFIKADQVWALGINGSGTVMAGNDTGLDITHPAIAPHYRGCLNPPDCTEIDNVYNWFDAYNPTNPNPWDDYGHGTHTTGTMVGDDGAGNQIGVAPGAQTVHCKNMMGGSGDEEHFILCFEWDLAPWDFNQQNPRPDLAPDAINNSWGFWGGGNDTMREAILNLQAAGVLVEVSAGNEGDYCSTLRSPGDYKQVLTTGSVNHAAPYPGTITGFSSRGPSSLDPSPESYFPDIMAPGENVRSALPGNQYDYWSGTSMAGPHATALVGLIWSANPSLRGQVDQTIDIIRDTATPLTGQAGSNCGGDYTTGPNNDWGFGTLDALAAVQAAIAMGGSGKLNGTVTDASTGDPLEGISIHAEHEEGFAWNDTTDATGYYTMTVAAGTFTVTASAYAYLIQEIAAVEVITDEVTTLNIEMDPAAIHTVSGHVYDAVNGSPLDATVEFTDAPVPPVNTDPSGFYSIDVAEGTWTMLVQAASHQSQTQVVDVTGDITVDFYLQQLPCILLVDDDDNAPSVTSFFTSALDNLGYDYDIFDVGGSTGNGPDLTTLQGYNMVFWYSGDKFGDSAGPNSTDEANLSAYLDGGGKLFLDSQDYLYDFQLTPFGQNYLGISSYDDDTGDASTIYGVDGDPISDGLGPFPLTYPADYYDYGDIVDPSASASLAFHAAAVGGNNLDIDKNGGDWQTVFFGTDWIAVQNNNPDNGQAIMQRVVDFFGGCEAPAAISISPVEQTKTGEIGTQVTYAYTVTNLATEPQDINLSVEANWPTEAPASTGELAAGVSTSVAVTVTIPTTFPAVIIDSDTFTLHGVGEVGGIANATGTTMANVTPAVDVAVPDNGSGKPLELVTYEFEVTNMGNYTDSFTLSATGVWTATLPGGNNTGPLAPGASATVTVQVLIPEGATQGETDVTTLTITSVLDPAVATSAEVTTTAILTHFTMLPIAVK